MSKKKFSGISAKGYYIALVLCAVAIAIAGYLYYRNGQEVTLQQPPTAGAQLSDQGNGDVQAVATQPGGSATQATTPYTGDGKKPSVVKKPVDGKPVVDYSMDALCYNQTTRDWRVHDGIDYAAETGTQVCAAAAGTVYTVYEDETMGTTVVIRHDGGYITQYASLAQQVSVKAGDTVAAGQPIGTVGATALLESAVGEHVHFSVSCNGQAIDPADFLS